jgi:nucleoside-diphosphate-sugar epimerase
MRVFLTGATGFIGSIIVEELKGAGHQVTGLARSDEAAAKLAGWGVNARRGDVDDPAGLAEAARDSDGVIHCAFGNDFSRYLEMGEIDQRAVTAVAEALSGAGKPLIVTSGMTTGVLGRPSTEADPAQTELPGMVRGRPEDLALAASTLGVRSVVVRLPPSVHDVSQQGLVTMLIRIARQTGVSAYVGEGGNRWPAVHRRDAAKLFRLALERGEAGTRVHAVGEPGVTLRAIAEAIGQRLAIPARSLGPEEAASHFGFFAQFIGNDIPASSAVTQESLGWRPAGPSLIDGLMGDYLS